MNKLLKIWLWLLVRVKNSRLFRGRRVPLVRQQSMGDCGAACLGMILGHFGIRAGLRECRAEIGAGRNGVSALEIKLAAEKAGLRSSAFSLQELTFDGRWLPAILHWKFNHFVVLESYSEKGIAISDPAAGRYTVTLEEFRNNFTGVALFFEKGADTVPAIRQLSRPSTFKFMLKYAAETPWLLFQIFFTSLLIQAFGIAIPFSTKAVIDSILPLGSPGMLSLFGVSMAAFLVGSVICGYLRSLSLVYIQGRIDRSMSSGLFEHLLSQPLSFFHERSNGDLMMRIGSLGMLRELLTGQALSIVLDGVTALLFLAAVFYLSPAFGLAAAAAGALYALVFFLTSARLQELVREEVAAQSESQGSIAESLNRIEFIKSSGRESVTGSAWADHLLKRLNASFERSVYQAGLDTFSSALRILSPLGLLWAGAYLVMTGSFSLGSVLAVNSLALAFLNPVAGLIAGIQRLQLAGTHLERIEDIYESEPEQEPGEGIDPPALSGKIEISGAAFSYNPGSRRVLDNIGISIAPGQKIAIAGSTGSGKSTLAKLLLGLYAPTEGEIFYDGIPLRSLDFQKLRSRIGVVLQEPVLFSGSIRKNISFGISGATFEDIVRAAKTACIHDEIMAMPLGYETLVAEGNAGLSGGQCQRIALARAVMADPPILLLDEATSSLDVITEAAVDRNLSALRCTRIVIAHRLSTVMNADNIYVLSDGKIAESGTHGELIAARGEYYGLFRSQMKTLGEKM